MQRTLIVLSLFASLQLAAQNCTSVILEDTTVAASWADGVLHPDGGMVGVWQLDDGSMDLKVARLDGNGTLLWQRRIATTNADFALIWAPIPVTCASNGDIILGGFRWSNDHNNCYAVRLDAQGNILWARIYQVHGVGIYEHVTDISALPNGGILMAVKASNGCYLVKLDDTGVPLWTRKFKFGATDPTFSDLLGEPDGDITIAGFCDFQAQIDNAAFIIHCDPLGNVEWYVNDSVSYLQGYQTVIRTSDGGYAIATGTGLMKRSDQGAFLWAKTYDGYSGYLTMVMELPAGDLLLGSKVDNYQTDLVHTSMDGTLVSSWSGSHRSLVGIHNDTLYLAGTSTQFFPYFSPQLVLESDPSDLSCSMTSSSFNTIVTAEPVAMSDTLTTAIDSIKTWTMSLIGQFPTSLDIVTNLSASAARPGFRLSYWGIAMNTGYNSSTPLSAAFTFDPLLTFNTAMPSGYTVVGNTVNWSGLAPLSMWEDQSFQINLTVPADTGLLGTVLSADLVVSQTNPETDIGNNSATVDRTVVGSYDPNDKLVWPETLYDITTDSILTYTIRFQNTGTDTAFTVVVTDTLPENVSVGSFEFLGASHPCTYEITAAGLLTFTFANILLVDSNMNEPMSHGLLSFRIRPDADITIGETISNSADIYFDFNPPVRTPPAVVTVGIPTGLPVQYPEALRIYPVPVKDLLNIALPVGVSARRISLTALDGHVVRNAPVSATTGTAQVSVVDLAQGIYVVTVDGTDGVRRSSRFVKE